MVVACSKTVARGWSKVVGESRDADKDVEPTARGNSEVRSEGDEDDTHTFKAGPLQTLGESFANGVSLQSPRAPFLPHLTRPSSWGP